MRKEIISTEKFSYAGKKGENCIQLLSESICASMFIHFVFFLPIRSSVRLDAE